MEPVVHTGKAKTTSLSPFQHGGEHTSPNYTAVLESDTMSLEPGRRYDDGAGG